MNTTPAPVITATFTLSKDDALALARHYYFTSPTVIQSRRWTHFAPPIAMILLSAVMLCQQRADLVTILPLPILAVAWATLYGRFHNWYLMNTAERMFKETTYEKAFGPCTIVLTEEGIHSTSGVGESKYLWSGVNRVVLTPGHLLIFLSGPMGFSLPRSQIPDPIIQEIKSVTERKIQASKSVTPKT